MNRYKVNSDEDFQPGSSIVLKNYLGVCDPLIIAEQETKALQVAYEYYSRNLSTQDPITPELIKQMHKRWLHKIYSFAGQYRTVFMSKGGVPFAAPGCIEKLMDSFGKNELKIYTPCLFKDIEQLSLALAVVHVEFILIHPFREGNGRIGRMISFIMGLQAGYPPLNFFSIENKNNLHHSKYIKAINLGLDRDYSAMQNIFRGILLEVPK